MFIWLYPPTSSVTHLTKFVNWQSPFMGLSKQAHADHSLFTHITSSSYMTLLVYVDYFVLVGTHLDELNKIKGILDQNFGIKDLGILKLSLGFEVSFFFWYFCVKDSIVSICWQILVYLAVNRSIQLWILVHIYRMMIVHPLGTWLVIDAWSVDSIIWLPLDRTLVSLFNNSLSFCPSQLFAIFELIRGYYIT